MKKHLHYYYIDLIIVHFKKISKMEQLNFSKNWNNKLDCQAFTTLRLPNPKYQVGRLFDITLLEETKGVGKITAIRYLDIEDIDEYIARLDTGSSVDACKTIIRNIYPHADFKQQQLALLLIVKEEGDPL